MSESSGGIRLAGSSSDASHGAESAGRRAYHSSPPAISSGPATRNRRAPSRPASVPIRVDRSASRCPSGADEPGAEGGVAEDALEDDRLVAERDVQRAVDEERREVDRR